MSKDQMDLIEKQAQFIEQMMSPKATITVKTLRDQLAMAALTGIASRDGMSSAVYMSRLAYELADAMLEARK
jgi:hypothetical protein